MTHKKIIIPGKTVTPANIEESIKQVIYNKVGEKIVICHMTLYNGHEVIGYAGVVHTPDFDLEMGKSVARAKAVSEVWKHLGAILQNQL
jgi:hypothetical protein